MATVAAAMCLAIVATGVGATQAIAAGAPTVLKLSQTAGPATGGTRVSIRGRNLQTTSAVHFGTATASFVIVSAQTVTAWSPPGRGTVDVTVTTPEGTSTTVSGDQFHYLPVLTSLSPNAGPMKGGTTVHISGIEFTGATAVSFGSLPATSMSVNSDESITAVSPPASTTGPVRVTVTTPQGTTPLSAGDVFKYAPAISSVSPDSGPAEGKTQVTIRGEGFGVGTTATIITFAFGRAGAVNCPTTTECIATSPAASRENRQATVDVKVKVKSIASIATPTDHFTYFEHPGLYLRRNGERVTSASATYRELIAAPEFETCFPYTAGSASASNGELDLDTGYIAEMEGCGRNALQGGFVNGIHVHVNPDGTAAASGSFGIQTPYGCTYEGSDLSGSLSGGSYLAVVLHGTLTFMPSAEREQLEYEILEIRSYIELLETLERTPAVEAEIEELRAYVKTLESRLAEQPECASSEAVTMIVEEEGLEVERVG
jgi:hypothetical protein